MVSFTSITQGVALVAIMMLSVSNAAPLLEEVTTDAVPHVDDSNFVKFDFPPIITTRTAPVKQPLFLGDLNAEVESIELNKNWYVKHNGNATLIDKRATDPETVAGLTMVVPANAPPVVTAASTAIVAATSAQITEFRHHAALSATTYCDSVVMSGLWTCTNCKKYVPDGKLIVTFNSAIREIGGYVLRSDNKKTIYLVFRGSHNWKNWVVNFDFIKTSYTPVSGATVHGGFYKAYKEVSSYFYAKLLAQHKAYPGYKVVVTGHSLGGAQALLATMDLYQRIATLNTSNLKLYSHGAPRVGNDQFAYYVDYTGLTIYRTVFDRDIVPHLPPQAFGFLHPGVEVWARTGTSAKICNPNIETKKCSNSIVPFTSFEDHRTYFTMEQGACI
ncbi:lipase [Pilaira anomala]|nr:lipase [Pilaira anomala]